jgi:ABC-type glycerol-3-phosphate transport system permease component
MLSRHAHAKIKNITLLIISYMFLLTVVLYVLFPIFWLFINAFKPTPSIYKDPLALPTSLYLDNWVIAFYNGGFREYFLNSLIVTLSTVVGVVSLSSLTGYALARFDFIGRKPIFTLIILGWTLPAQMVFIPLFHLHKALGLLNTYFALIITYVSFGIAFGTLLMRSFFKGLPKELEDAAYVDGCSHFQVFTKIMLPLAKPALGSLTAFQFLWSWNEFFFALILIQKPTLRTLPLGLMYFFGEHIVELGPLTAACAITVILPLVIYTLFNRYFIRGLTAGAIKG